jgi:hypothetical protein
LVFPQPAIDLDSREIASTRPFIQGGFFKVLEELPPLPPRRKPSRLGGAGCLAFVAGIVFCALSEQNVPIGIFLTLIGAAILLYALITGKIATSG